MAKVSASSSCSPCISVGTVNSFRLDTCFADNSAILLVIANNQFTELLARAKVQGKSKRRHAALNVGKLGDLLDGLDEPPDDFRGHSGRCHDTKPVRRLKSRHRAFSYRRH